MTAYRVEQLADILGAETPWLSVRIADRLPGPDWIGCGPLLATQRAGGDPTAMWRKQLGDQQTAQYGVRPPASVAAMFVLMWYVGLPALIAGRSVALSGVSPDVAPEALAFRRHPAQHYPAEVALLSRRVVPMAEAVVAATEHCRAFADSYRPGVKLGSRQLHGAIEDEIRAAIPVGAPYAEEAAGAFGVDLTASWRTSCCFIYALPGTHPCASCPRLAETPRPHLS